MTPTEEHGQENRAPEPDEARTPGTEEASRGAPEPDPPATELEAAARRAEERMKARRRPASENASDRKNRFLLFWAFVVTAAVLLIAYFQGDDLFNLERARELETLIPFAMAFVGVALFVMDTARRKKDQWDFRKYRGEHAYRVAQAMGYLLIVWWAWATVVTGDGAEAQAGAEAASGGAGVPGTDLPPNILGFLVGLFILRVERAMEGLGDKFEEVLKAVLPRAVAYESAEDRKRAQTRARWKMDELAGAWRRVRGSVEDSTAREAVDRCVDLGVEVCGGEDARAAAVAVADVERVLDGV